MQLEKNQPHAFTVVELLVVILILAILAGVLVPRVTDRLAAARDARRVSDLHRVRDAVEQYFLDKGVYPAPTVAADGDGYDVTSDHDFIPELVKTGYLREPARDPLDDARHFYAYNVFAQGTNGCKGKGAYYVLGIKQFETASFAATHAGYFKCSHKNWSADFEYVTGGGASEL